MEPVPEPPPPSPSAAKRAAKRAGAFTILTLIALATPVGLVLSSALTGSKVGLWTLILLLGVGIPLAIALLAWRSASTGRRMRERGQGLGMLDVVRGPLRSTSVVRGQFAGRGVRVFRDRLELEVPCPQPARLTRQFLLALASGEATSSPFGRTGVARDSAARLLALGVTLIDVEDQRVTVRGSSAKAAELLPHALELALAPATVRLAPPKVGDCGCPFCRQPLGSVLKHPLVRCPACDAMHHAECWQDHGGCSVFRCKRAPQVGRERPPVAEPEPNGEAASQDDAPPLTIQIRERV